MVCPVCSGDGRLSVLTDGVPLVVSSLFVSDTLVSGSSGMAESDSDLAAACDG